MVVWWNLILENWSLSKFLQLLFVYCSLVPFENCCLSWQKMLPWDYVLRIWENLIIWRKSVIALLEWDDNGRLRKDFLVARESMSDIFFCTTIYMFKRRGFNNVNMNMGNILLYLWMKYIVNNPGKWWIWQHENEYGL